MIVLSQIVLKENVKFDDIDSAKSTILALFAVGIALTAVNYLVSSIQRNAIFRLIPCFGLRSNLEFVTIAFRLCIIMALTFAYSVLAMFDIPTLRLNSIDIVFMYRAYNRLFHAPNAASLETLGLLIYLGIEGTNGYTDRPFMILFLISVCLHRLMIFGNKCLYVLISIVTAFKNKKQRFKM